MARDRTSADHRRAARWWCPEHFRRISADARWDHREEHRPEKACRVASCRAVFLMVRLPQDWRVPDGECADPDGCRFPDSGIGVGFTTGDIQNDRYRQS